MEAVITLQPLEVMVDQAVVAVGIPALQYQAVLETRHPQSHLKVIMAATALAGLRQLMAGAAVVGLVEQVPTEQVVLAGLVEMERPHPFRVPLLLMLVGVEGEVIHPPVVPAGLVEQAVVGMEFTLLLLQMQTVRLGQEVVVAVVLPMAALQDTLAQAAQES